MSVNKSVTVPVGSGFLSVTLQASQIALACVGAQFPTQGRGELSVVLRTPRALFRGPLASSGGGIRTRDLRVMSPTSYQTAPPRVGSTILARPRMNSQGERNTRVRPHRSRMRAVTGDRRDWMPLCGSP